MRFKGSEKAMTTENNRPITDAPIVEETIIKPAAPEILTAPKVITLPPNILLIAIVAGIVLNWIIPISFGYVWGGAGLLLLALSIGVIYWCKKLFDEAETNIRPDMPSLALVTTGPYKYSRNPIYTSFLVGYAGLAMLADAPIMLLLLLPLWYALDKYVIQPEEDYLAEKFGAEYIEYMGLTHRWLGVKQDFFS